MERFDLLVVGGGINGAAIARAAALGGHRVLLVEQGDLGHATSSASTKLIHGGLRYLEQFEFKLVRESLKERAVMLRIAPHLVSPLEFLIPYDATLRPWPMLRAGLLLYDLLAVGGALPRSRAVRADAGGGRSVRALSYWDARVDDARLVVLNALDAAEHGGAVRTRTRLTRARRDSAGWVAQLADCSGGASEVVAAAIVNAAGPWVSETLNDVFGAAGRSSLRLVRGSHIVLPRLYPDERARLLQQKDGRIVFLIPYQDDFTLVGTTDIPAVEPGDSEPTPAEIAYLLGAANAYLGSHYGEISIVWRFGGVRALYDDGSANPSKVTRDYHLELSGDPPLLSVFGGKVTTARHLADEVLDRLGLAPGDTAAHPLPGGECGPAVAFAAACETRWPFLPAGTVRRMAHAYGSRTSTLLGDAVTIGDLGHDFGHGLFEREVTYLHRVEWARNAEDILWRRTKLGLRFTAEEAARLDGHLRELEA
ncbi:glycerol-3-phosphate dehydrogenase [Flavisphingomonas formosensis]|uniref:glycerol-3-phosphate dehydrogenase n=1 Tax=Flavisphingomonas formosensis TaxID=861534 RepID=UPI0012F87B4F|nr:glycerol-3-phosphate dehydrogenase [Sphingomonas formosensis]